MKSFKITNNNLLPIQTIISATMSNIDSINGVLKHYERYIIALSSKTLYDEDGSKYLYVDEELRRRLETKLITKILKFKVA